MEIKRIKALAKKNMVLAACRMSDKETLYLKVDKRDLQKALKFLKETNRNHVRAHWAEKSKVLYIGE